MSGTRKRIISASADLLRCQGYTGTGVKQIVAAAGAPFGSLYRFFPGGKEQLGAETIRWPGQIYGRLLPLIFDASPDLVSGVRAFFAAAAGQQEDTGYADGCPIATVAKAPIDAQARTLPSSPRRLEELFACYGVVGASAGIWHGKPQPGRRV